MNIENTETDSLLIQNSKNMKHVCKILERHAFMDINLFIGGEPGSGKEFLARSIHKMSKRPGAFVSFIRNSAMNENPDVIKDLNESVNLCKEGTFYIKEAASLSPVVQEHLVGILKSKLENNSSQLSQVRFITSSSHNLKKLSDKGIFNKTLYSLLCIASVEVPPLRERTEDIEDMTRFFLNSVLKRGDKPFSINDNAMEALLYYDWPGNIGELKQTLYHGVMNAENNEINLIDLPEKLQVRHKAITDNVSLKKELFYIAKNLISGAKENDNTDAYEEYIKMVETPFFQAALVLTKGNKAEAARITKISRNTLSKKLKDYELDNFSPAKK